MSNYIIFIRGVMPTGKNKVPMTELRAVLERAGLEDVETYIQSGNVIVSTELLAGEVETLVHERIEKHFGGDLVIIARTPAQMKEVMSKNPFKEEEASHLYFTLLSEKPSKELLQEFQAIDFSPDKVKIIGNVIYTCYATKYSDSKFNNNWFERKLKVSGTTRNWNTMTKLIEEGK